MSIEPRETVLARRRARFVEHIKAERTSEEIADIEGMDTDDARKQRKSIAEEEHLPLPPNRRAGFVPLGLKEENRKFRTALGYMVIDLQKVYHPTEVAHMIGLTKAQQTKAKNGKSTHNWTVGQMQRLADAMGLTFDQLVQKALAYQDVTYASLRTR